jgi:universal stress protein A
MIQNFKKILAPLDFSEHSMQALRGAWELSRDNNAELHILHVVAPHHSFIPAVEPSREAAREAGVVQQTEQELARIKKDDFGNSPRITTSVAVGPPVTAICQYVSDNKIDLIVVSTHGRTGAEHMLIGSVAEKLVRHSPCPVLVLRRSS